jgi:hypothetical protein
MRRNQSNISIQGYQIIEVYFNCLHKGHFKSREGAFIAFLGCDIPSAKIESKMGRFE